ncbi:cytochrome P450 [Hymenopellis radicata]|nr:cytochrome P450 [Hymenopellis radicata]
MPPLVYSLFKIVLYPRYFSPLQHIPGPPLGHPLFGQLNTLHGPNVGSIQQAWFKRYGSIVRVIAPLGMERLVIKDEEALSQILDRNWGDWDKAPYIETLLRIMAGNTGMMTTYGDTHQRLRKLFNPAFSLANVAQQSDMYYAPIEGFLKKLRTLIDDDVPKESVVVPVAHWLNKITLDLLCKSVFGYECDSVNNPDEPLARAYEGLAGLQTGSNIATLFLITCVPGGTWLLTSPWSSRRLKWVQRLGGFPARVARFLEYMTVVREITRDMIHQKVSDASGMAVTRKDVMSILVHARQNDHVELEGLSDDDLVDQVLTFMTGGHETISAAVSWTLWFLANDQDRQQRLRAESASIFDQDGKPDFRKLKSLVYLDAVLSESLRIMTPIPVSSRVANKDVKLKGINVPKGTHIHVCFRNVGTSEERWGETAEQFIPERWLDLPDSYDTTFSRFMFGVGPRACIGKNMALMEIKALLVSILAEFLVEPAYAGQTYRAEHIITYKPADGLPLTLRALNWKSN